MKVRLVLKGCKPFSINEAFYAKSFNLTQKCRIWRDTIIKALNTEENLEAMRQFREAFDPMKNGISLAISHSIPKPFFFKLNGEISIRSKDLTNVEKLPQDIIFDKKYMERKVLENLGLDDKYVVKLYSEKIVDKHYKIVVELSIVDMTPHWERVKNWRG